MKTTYIYLNKYVTKSGKVYLYVGSHTWSGAPGTIDPSYYGSSAIATRYGWKPSEISILEVVDEERRYTAEREWINKYCSLYGVARFAYKFTKNSPFLAKFPSNGIMLNLHSNSMENTHSPEALKRRLESAILSGGQAKAQHAATLAGHSKESIHKMWSTFHKTGAIPKFVHALNTPEAVKNRVASRLASSQRVFLSDGFEGNAHEISVHLGMKYNTAKCYVSLAHKHGKFTLHKGPFVGLAFTKVSI